MNENDEETALRALALQIAIQIPRDTCVALRLVNALRDIVLWRAGKPSGREERAQKLRLVRMDDLKDLAG